MSGSYLGDKASMEVWRLVPTWVIRPTWKSGSYVADRAYLGDENFQMDGPS